MTVRELMDLLMYAEPDAIVGFAHGISSHDLGSAVELSATVLAGHALDRGKPFRPAIVLVSNGIYLAHGFAPEAEDGVTV